MSNAAIELAIRPYDGIGPLTFGMDSNTVRAALGGQVRTFLKTPEAAVPTDAFDELGIHVYYDEGGRCEAVEVTFPAAPVLQGEALLGRLFEELRAFFERLDPATQVDATGLTAPTLGVGLFSPLASDSPNEPVEGVIVFRKGYYD